MLNEKRLGVIITIDVLLKFGSWHLDITVMAWRMANENSMFMTIYLYIG